MKELIAEYRNKKVLIKKRLKEFGMLYKKKDKIIFPELCFCILTPQSRAVYCDRAVRELKRKDLLYNGGRYAVRKTLAGVRFPNNKAAYLIEARKYVLNGKWPQVKKMLNPDSAFAAREWLVKNIKGLGYKEASHFLRNIGLGREMAILDTHILRNLKKYKVIKKIPASINRKAYFDIENKMRNFSRRINIPLEELDLLFWSGQTGFIFK